MMEALFRVDPRAKLVCLFVFVIAALHARSAAALGLCVVVSAAFALAVRLTGRDIRAVFVPLAPILVVTVIMQVLYVQQGNVLAWIGPVALTTEALAQAARMLVSLFAIMLASVSFMRCTPLEDLMGTLRWLLSPLRAIGVRTEAFMLALTVAFRFIPVFVGEFGQLKRAQLARGASFDGSVRKRLGSNMRLFAPLVRSAFRRADTLAEALVARCFSCGRAPTMLRSAHFKVADVAFCVTVFAVSAIVFAL